jgi:hypothetical protein
MLAPVLPPVEVLEELPEVDAVVVVDPPVLALFFDEEHPARASGTSNARGIKRFKCFLPFIRLGRGDVTGLRRRSGPHGLPPDWNAVRRVSMASPYEGVVTESRTYGEHRLNNSGTPPVRRPGI